MTQTVLDACGLHAVRQLLAHCDGCRRVVGMTQLIDVQRFDFVLGPTEQICPRGVDAEEIAVEICNAEQILGHLPDAITFAGALLHFRFKSLCEYVQRLFIAHALRRFEGGDKHATNSTRCGRIRDRAVADCKPRLFRDAVSVDQPRVILCEETFALAAQDCLIEDAEFTIDFRPYLAERLS